MFLKRARDCNRRLGKKDKECWWLRLVVDGRELYIMFTSEGLLYALKAKRGCRAASVEVGVGRPRSWRVSLQV